MGSKSGSKSSAGGSADPIDQFAKDEAIRNEIQARMRVREAELAAAAEEKLRVREMELRESIQQELETKFGGHNTPGDMPNLESPRLVDDRLMQELKDTLQKEKFELERRVEDLEIELQATKAALDRCRSDL